MEAPNSYDSVRANREETTAAGRRLVPAFALAAVFVLGFGMTLWAQQPGAPGLAIGSVEEGNAAGQGETHFDRLRRLEAAYEMRIERMLGPIVGPAGVRAWVAVDLRPDTAAQAVSGSAGKDTSRGAEDRLAGRVGSLSAVVVIDRGTPEQSAASGDLTGAQGIEAVTALVEKAVGYDAGRGDSIRIVRVTSAGPPQENGTPLFWKWVFPALGAGIFALLLAWGLMRMASRRAASRSSAAQAAVAGAAGPGREAESEADSEDRDFEEQLQRIRAIAMEDPARVARVVRRWIAAEG